MANLTTKTLPQLVQGMAAAVQGLGSGLLDFTVGSILRAVVEATAAVVLWLQGLILAVLVAARASTAQGEDLDTWIADLGTGPTADDPDLIARFGAVGASGTVTFSRLTTTGQAVVPVGATVSSRDGVQQYSVILDTANPAYSAALSGYVLAIGVSAINCKVSALTAGAASNAAAGAVTTITSAMPGVDAATNAAAFTNGMDAESDAAFLSRFRLFIAALREATPKALAFAITSLQLGVQCLCVELVQHDGVARRSFFYFVVDDGTGAPPVSLVNAAGVVIDAHRAAGIEFGVYASVIVTADVSMVVVSTPTSTHSTVVALVASAVLAYLNSVPLGTPVYYSRVWQVAHDASPDVVEITGLTLGGVAADLAITVNQVAKAGALAIT